MRPERGFKKAVGHGRVDSGPEEGAGRPSGLSNGLDGPGEFAAGGCGRGKQHGRAGAQHAQHGACMVGMGGYDFSVQFGNNKKSFFSAEKAGGAAAGRKGQKGGGRQFTLLWETATVLQRLAAENAVSMEQYTLRGKPFPHAVGAAVCFGCGTDVFNCRVLL